MCVVVRVSAAVLQIETNRNTALTLACFQGRHEVVSLLCQRGANVEHRAKVGEGEGRGGWGRGQVVSWLNLGWFLGIGVAPSCVCVCHLISVLVCCVCIADWSDSTDGGCLRWLP